MADKQWFLLKHNDKQIRGPVSLSQLKSWAIAAKIGPMDRVSCDNKASWSRAPMVPDLQMDWLVELDDNYLYGPTSIAAIQEFISSGEIQETDNIINCLDNQRMPVAQCPAFANYIAHQAESTREAATAESPAPESATSPAPSPKAATAPGNQAERIDQLESTVQELQEEVKALKERQLELLSTLHGLEGKEIPPDTISYLI